MVITNSKPKKGKQAVVFIHGQGEQVPMETLNEFVDSVWVTDPTVYGKEPHSGNLRFNSVWGKPDSRNNSHELRRITTKRAKNGYRTDFYSFYWADLMRGNTWQHFTGWLAGLLLRSPRRVPSNVMLVWVFLWLVTVIIALFMLNQFAPLTDMMLKSGLSKDSVLYKIFQPRPLDQMIDTEWFNKNVLFCLYVLYAAIPYIITFFIYWLVRLLTHSFGDAARYTTPKPGNIAKRQVIRERGVTLLKTLMGVNGWDEDRVLAYYQEHGEMPKWQTDYDKIIVVSHSLGTIIGYDILRQTFADVSKYTLPVKIGTKKTPHQPTERKKLEAYLAAGISGKEDYDPGIFRQKQAACFEELRDLGSPWIISDFVTLGSPLTHAEFLMSYNMVELRYKQEKRIFPTCPPTLEPDSSDDAGRFSYKSTVKSKGKKSLEFDHMHHAAHFAVTLWTNMHSSAKCILWGDLISGPVADHFDFALRGNGEKALKGVRDIRVMPTETAANKGESTPFFTHNKYWKWREKKDWIAENPEQPGELPDHIGKLRHVLRLTRKSNLK